MGIEKKTRLKMLNFSPMLLVKANKIAMPMLDNTNPMES